MRIAVVGAGIMGVTTAYELASDGHEVTLFERQATVAAETSFANAGLIAPGYVAPWAAPGMLGKVLRHLFSAHTPVRISAPLPPMALPWLWRWWRACGAKRYRANREQLYRLAHYSRARLHHVSRKHGLEYEQTRGVLVLMRSPRDLALAQPGLKLMADLGVKLQVVDAARALQLEPGLNAGMPLHAAIHLPDDETGNCRQFAQLLRNEFPSGQVEVRLGHDVLGLQAGAPVTLRHRLVTAPADGAAASGARTEIGAIQSQSFDEVVLCTGARTAEILAPLGLRLPLISVHGYSVTAPLRERAQVDFDGPKSALMDEHYKVAITRIGQRVRVAGGAEIGGPAQRHNEAALATLYKVLDDWFPGCAHVSKAQAWKGARPMLPDGPPIIGASGLQGILLNAGHGSSGWALACGSARVLADLVAQRRPEIDTEGLGIERLHL